MSQFDLMDPSVLRPNPWNPNVLPEEDMAHLVEEVSANRAMNKPVICRFVGRELEIVDGEHTARAARMAGLPMIPIQLVDIDDFEAMRQTFTRNISGENDPVKLARMMERMKTLGDGGNRAVARALGRSEGFVRNILAYLEAATHQRNELPESEIAGMSVRQVREHLKTLSAPLGDTAKEPDEVRNSYAPGQQAQTDENNAPIEEAAANDSPADGNAFAEDRDGDDEPEEYALVLPPFEALMEAWHRAAHSERTEFTRWAGLAVASEFQVEREYLEDRVESLKQEILSLREGQTGDAPTEATATVADDESGAPGDAVDGGIGGDESKSFGARVRQARKSRGWSQSDLAAESGVSRPAIGNIENSRWKPSAENRAKLEAALFFGADEPTLPCVA